MLLTYGCSLPSKADPIRSSYKRYFCSDKIGTVEKWHLREHLGIFSITDTFQLRWVAKIFERLKVSVFMIYSDERSKV